MYGRNIETSSNAPIGRVHVHFRAEHELNLQVVLKASNDQDHADRNGEQRKNHGDATGNNTNALL
jgi:hypothetical protein